MSHVNVDLAFKPLFPRHDLMVELGRLEMVMEDARSHPAGNDADQLAHLEAKFQRVSEELRRLPV